MKDNYKDYTRSEWNKLSEHYPPFDEVKIGDEFILEDANYSARYQIRAINKNGLFAALVEEKGGNKNEQLPK